ncbi:MAG: hypothetical protein ACRCS8_06580 [Brevinema sp.]
MKLFMRPLTAYIFGLSFIANLIFNLTRSFGIIKSFTSSIVSGLIFVIFWAIFLRTLQIILNEKELREIFLLPSSDELGGRTYSNDDSDDLTMDEIYQSMGQDDDLADMSPGRTNRIASNEHQDDSTGSIDEIDFSILDSNEYHHTPEAETGTSDIGPDGKFTLTVNHQTIRTTPETGAKAARKLINDDKNNS